MYRDVQEDQQLVDLQTCSETSCCIIFLWRIQNKPTSTEDYGNPQARETLACQTEEGKVHIHFKYLTEQHHCEMDLSKKTSITKFYVIRNFRHNEGTTFYATVFFRIHSFIFFSVYFFLIPLNHDLNNCGMLLNAYLCLLYWQDTWGIVFLDPSQLSAFSFWNDLYSVEKTIISC